MMMLSPITPTIEIHPAIDEDSVAQTATYASPYSPQFTSHMVSSPESDSDSDELDSSFRPTHLLPPPSPVHRPTVRSSTTPADKKGLDQDRFQELLSQSRQRASQTFAGRKEPVELRKHVALKAHKSRALERRALFLSKVEALPSPTATRTPATPPESPSIFHFSLPSPGLNSPISWRNQIEIVVSNESGENNEGIKQGVVGATQDVTKKTRESWIEEIDFKTRIRSAAKAEAQSPGFLGMERAGRNDIRQRITTRAVLPSLDQITARLAAAKIGKEEHTLASPIRSSGLNPRNTHRRAPSAPSITITTPVSARPPIPLPAFLKRDGTVQPRNASPPPPPVVAPQQSTPPDGEEEPAQNSSSVINIASPPRRRPNPLPPLRAAEPFQPRPVTTRLPYITMSPPGESCSPTARTQKGRDMVEKLRRRSSAPAELPKKKDDSVLKALRGGF